MAAEFEILPQTPSGKRKQASAVSPAASDSLDPPNWSAFRAQAHRMLDDILDYTENIRQRPVWQPVPDQVRERFHASLPLKPSDLAEVHREFINHILPFAVGNVHPGFMGWVHGGGTPVGMLAEMLAAGLNANVGGRDQVPIEVEQQISRWMQGIFGFPETAAGLFVTGTSMANFIAIKVARDAALDFDVRRKGVSNTHKRLTAYASTEVHGCIAKAMDLCGIGSDALRRIPIDSRRRMDVGALDKTIREDREAGFQPFLIVGTAGTVDTGAIDDLSSIADVARREKLWFHVDGAYGALAMFAPDLAPKLAGIERADSLAFDFHKWGQVPYDAGFILVRDGTLQRSAFAASSAYLRRETRGLAAGSHWPCDYGPDLSRGFRALKTWFTLKVYGTQAIGSVISRTCDLARYLEQQIAKTSELELLVPVELNIVCFRYRSENPDTVNGQIVVELQESGEVAPSTTTVDGHAAIRAAIVNHRTAKEDIDTLVNRTLDLGRKIVRDTQSSAHMNTLAESPVKWEANLREVECQLTIHPDSFEFRFQRGLLLAKLGRLVDARNDYIKVLERQPHHLAALNNLGCILIATGHRKAARIAYNEAVLRHPNDPTSRVNLGNLLLEEGERQTAHGHEEEALQLEREAATHFQHALQLNANDEKAHEGLSYVFAHLGDAAAAQRHRRAAFQNRSVIAIPFCGVGAPLPVLLLAATTGGNVRLQKFLDDHIFQTYVVTPEFLDEKTALPLHRLVINAIGDAETSPEALMAAQRVLARTTAPVINSPSAVLATGRSDNAKRLSGLPGVITAITATLDRAQLTPSQAAATLARHGFEFPILLRTPGFHTGLHFLRVENVAELPSAIEKLPGEEVIVMQYLDARGQDGKSRKYRVMMIGGELYPLHCAISSHWKIHYFTAEMAESTEHRAEDAAFLANMPEVLGPTAMRALRSIQSSLGLDYGGIDFGLSSKGEVLLFEANATMVVNPPDPEEHWKYRQPAYERIREAIQRMLIGRADKAVAAGAAG
jgi:aromatic-L-amino-acid/L-tryptophan decarboxylase